MVTFVFVDRRQVYRLERGPVSNVDIGICRPFLQYQLT